MNEEATGLSWKITMPYFTFDQISFRFWVCYVQESSEMFAGLTFQICYEEGMQLQYCCELQWGPLSSISLQFQDGFPQSRIKFDHLRTRKNTRNECKSNLFK